MTMLPTRRRRFGRPGRRCSARRCSGFRRRTADQARTDAVLPALGLTRALGVRRAARRCTSCASGRRCSACSTARESGEALRIARSIRTERPQAVLVGIVDPNRPESSLEAFRAGVFDVLPSPHRAVGSERGHLERAGPGRPGRPNRTRRTRVQVAPYGVFGSSPAMRKIIDVLPRVAPSRCPILLYGERGTGREMLARTIHGHGRRPDAPFVVGRLRQRDAAGSRARAVRHRVAAPHRRQRRAADDGAHQPRVAAGRSVGRHAVPAEPARDADARAGQAASRAARSRGGAHERSQPRRARHPADRGGRSRVRERPSRKAGSAATSTSACR